MPASAHSCSRRAQPTLRRLAASILFLAAIATRALPAQGPFVNYEDPQVKPAAIATVGSGPSAQRYALLCNTPDNSVEIYRCTYPFAFVARVPVGLSPVTVRWNAQNGRFYTCNYLGDSVTCVRLDEITGPPASVAPVVERTVFVGDQPADIAFLAGNTQCIVSLDGRSGVALLSLPTLSTITPVVHLKVDGTFPQGGARAPKAPRGLAVMSDQRLYALNHIGGDVGQATFDFGLFVSDPNNPPPGQNANLYAVGGIGSTNFNLAIASSGTRMFVAAQIAKNDGADLAAVTAEATGFVQTWLKVVELVPGAPGGPPAVALEQAGGTGTKALWRSIDLNRDYTLATPTALTTNRIAQVTDVVLVEDGAGVQRIVLAAFGSDKVVVLTPNANDPSGYSRTHIALPVVDDPLSADVHTAAGPRGLVLDPLGAVPGSSSPSGLVWVVNRLDNSFAIVDPWAGTLVAQQSMKPDPTPADIQRGRKFLYTAAATSGSGMVSCASCHVDGRTDTLVWNLGVHTVGPRIPAHFHDGNGQDTVSMPRWPAEKGLMVTQTLQGLLNSHVEPYEARNVTTNAPYHWRGDKFDFTDFNEAFVNLQGMSDVLTGVPIGGLSTADMADFHRFINTIHHPPNPEEAKNRKLSGELGNPDSVADGSGGKLGMKLFHIAGVFEDKRSCVQCHALPEGSNNRLTSIFDGIGGSPDHPFEAAALRSMFQREIVVPTGFGPSAIQIDPVTDAVTLQPATVRNGLTGLLHAGFLTLAPAVENLHKSLSINDNVHHVFQFSSVPATDAARKAAVTEFLRHLDTGTAPIIGLAYTVDPAQSALNNSVLGILEEEVGQANAGLAVHTRNAGVTVGYWFDPRDARYYPEGGGSSIDRATLLALATGNGNVVIAQATPTGSERRIASTTGVATVLTGSAPVASTIAIRPMAPNTFFEGVASLKGNWDPNHPTMPFVFVSPGPGSDEPFFAKSVRALQTAVASQFGMPANPLRHEPPRRLRVVGDNIRPGARLDITMATQTAGSLPGQTISFDLAPTKFTFEGKTIWETAEELDAMHTMAWLNGGYFAPGVTKVIEADYSGTALLVPLTWNKYRVTVTNEDGTSGTNSTWQSLFVQDTR
jgi:hypothetical protein